MSEKEDVYKHIMDIASAYGFTCYICGSINRHPDHTICSAFVESAPLLVFERSAPSTGHSFLVEASCPQCKSKFLISLSSLVLEDNSKP